MHVNLNNQLQGSRQNQVGQASLIGPCTVPSAMALVQMFAQRKETVSSVYTHTNAAALPHFPMRHVAWHDESKDRRKQSVTKQLFKVLFIYQMEFNMSPFTIINQLRSPFSRRKSAIADES